MSKIIHTAELDWQCIDGIEIPVSKIFGDVYFSKDNGLLETRHVFINGNDLPTRLADLSNFEYFIVGETGFGTGLNILTLWQLWQQVRPDNHSHLHAISVEKFPLKKEDLVRALNAWPELKPLSEQLIEKYPLPIAGCHRLSFPEERFSLDLWLGDAHDVFPEMVRTQSVNAWFLDGFAPACNPDMWEENVLNHIIRLSDYGTTFASFSVAGVLKRGLKKHGVSISRPRGFGHKREMLKAVWHKTSVSGELNPDLSSESSAEKKMAQQHQSKQVSQIAIIGAGVAGLTCAWAFAQRGYKVRIYDQSEPLSGASGNPLALLNPKLCPIEQASEHLMTLAWQHALRHYARFTAFRPIQVNQLALKNPVELLQLADQYPDSLLKVHSAIESDVDTSYDSLKLIQAGAVSPQQLKEQILQHSNIEFHKIKISTLTQNEQVHLFDTNATLIDQADHVIVCTAQHSAQFFQDYPKLKPIRGQVSWLNNNLNPLKKDQAYSYGGYCMQLDDDHLILGASFYPNRDDDEVLLEDHVHNFNLIHSVFPEYAESLIPIAEWYGRASVRAQSLDYFPLLGRLNQQDEIYTFSGLGSKGFLFAPLCSEVLIAEILGEACPIPASLLKKLQVSRFQKKAQVKKPYYQKDQNLK